MTPSQLRAWGEALYGSSFTAPLADDLNISPRTVRKWLNGQAAIPPGAAAELVAIGRELHVQLGELLA